jgi:TRAP transporter 4TM/12TM fusion protein
MNVQDKTMAQEGAKMPEVTSITNEELIAAAESAESPGIRHLPPLIKYICLFLTVLGVGASIFHLFGYNIAGKVMWPRAYYALLMGCFLPIVFLLVPHRKGASWPRWFDYVGAFLSLAVGLFLFLNASNIEYKGWHYTAPLSGVIAAFLLCAIVLETSRRSSGGIFCLICFIGFTFPFYTHLLPGILGGIGFNLGGALRSFVYGSEGVFGIVMKVMGDILMGYMVFANVLLHTGGGKFFVNLAFSLVGSTRGGPAKVAIIGSALFGTISGAPVANVATIGSITIPAMKKLGYRPEYAAAVETCASSGGVLMPPVMGATAFIMAEVLGVTYADVCIAAALPAILFYLSLMIQVDLQSIKLGLKGLPKSELPPLKETLIDGWPYVLAIALLIYELLYLRDATRAPYHVSAVLLIITSLKKTTRLSRDKWLKFIQDTGSSIATLLATLLGVGFVIGALTMTGIAYSFSNEVMALAGHNAYLLLVLGAGVSFVIGLGATVTVCYIFLALTMAPPLVQIGFSPMAVHLFVLYWANLENLTPPVALPAFLAAAIAGADPIKTTLTSMRLATLLYILPFVFVMEPSLILQGPWPDTILHFTTFLIGAVFIAFAAEGSMYGVGRLSGNLIPYRVLSLVAGLSLILPWWIFKLVGAILALISLLPFWRKRFFSTSGTVYGGN